MSNFSVQALRKKIDTEWYALERACDAKQPAGRMLESALAAAIDGERRHRTMGRGIASGRYRVGVELAARSHVLRWVTDPQCSRALPPEELMTMRLDVAYCYAIRRLLGDAASALPEHGVSYVDDLVG